MKVTLSQVFLLVTILAVFSAAVNMALEKQKNAELIEQIKYFQRENRRLLQEINVLKFEIHVMEIIINQNEARLLNIRSANLATSWMLYV